MQKRVLVSAEEASDIASPLSSASSVLSSPPDSETEASSALVPLKSESKPSHSVKTSSTKFTVVGRKRVKTKVEIDEDNEGTILKIEEVQSTEAIAKESKVRKPRPKKEKIGELGEDGQPKPKRRRKTKEEKEAEAMPLALRTTGLAMYVGAHVSIAKGVQNAVTNSVHIGGNAFALFLKNQRRWESPPMLDKDFKAFIKGCEAEAYDTKKHIVPHGSYLVNLGTSEPDKATKAYDAFLDDLKRCEQLGVGKFNFHPGSTIGQPRPDTIKRIATAINKAHKDTNFVKLLLENMANRGNIIGGAFEDLRDIIALVDDKQRVGVCLDTCHAFAAGYDLRTPLAFSKTLHVFNEVIGLQYLSAIHLNDSKAPFDSHRDLHENIGLGFLGLSSFRNIMNCKEFAGLPMVLETPMKEEQKWADEIKLLEGLIGVDESDEAYLAKAEELSSSGSEARKIMQEKFDKKVADKLKKATGGKTRKKDGDIGKMFSGKAKEESHLDSEDSGLSSCAGHDDTEESDENERDKEVEEKLSQKSKVAKVKQESTAKAKAIKPKKK